MVVILVKWKIKPGREDEARAHWEQKLHIADRRGLVGEFLCEPGSQNYITWGLPDLTIHRARSLSTWEFGLTTKHFASRWSGTSTMTRNLNRLKPLAGFVPCCIRCPADGQRSLA